MRFYFREVSLRTGKKIEIVDVSDRIRDAVGESGIDNGLVNIWVPHSTATITVNERDVDLWEDILAVLERNVPVKGEYRHNIKYGWIPDEQNAHAHIISSIIKPNVTVPLSKGRMLLGTWQSILFIEMDGPRQRTILVQVMGE